MHTEILNNDVTEPKASTQGYSNRLKSCFVVFEKNAHFNSEK